MARHRRRARSTPTRPPAWRSAVRNCCPRQLGVETGDSLRSLEERELEPRGVARVVEVAVDREPTVEVTATEVEVGVDRVAEGRQLVAQGRVPAQPSRLATSEAREPDEVGIEQIEERETTLPLEIVAFLGREMRAPAVAIDADAGRVNAAHLCGPSSSMASALHCEGRAAALAASGTARAGGAVY